MVPRDRGESDAIDRADNVTDHDELRKLAEASIAERPTPMRVARLEFVGIAASEESVLRLLDERDAWAVATGEAMLTPEEAGDHIDADDMQRQDMRELLLKMSRDLPAWRSRIGPVIDRERYRQMVQEMKDDN